jgi:hypothetical protein
MRVHLLSVFRGAALALALAGAGCGSSGTSSNPDPFVGTWTYQSGSIVPNCSGITLGDIDLTGDAVTITKADATHIVMVVAATGAMCNVRFTVKGTTATVDTGQTCAINDSGYSATLNVSTWTLSMANDTITTAMSGTATVAIITCAPTSTGTMVRSSPDAAQGG